MTPLRRAILVVSIPAVAWVYLHGVSAWAYDHGTFVPDAMSQAWHQVFTEPGFWESELLVVALAGAAWALAGTAKSKS